MYQSPLVTGLSLVFAAMSAVLVGAAALSGSWLALLPAALFAAVAYFMWYHASGRLADRIYRTMETVATGSRSRERPGGFGAGPRGDWERPRGGRDRGRRRATVSEDGRGRRRGAARTNGRGDPTPGSVGGQPGTAARSEAAAILGVDPGADEATVRSAYRRRIKEVHPDTEGGDEEAFKRVRDAYEHLIQYDRGGTIK